MVMLLAAGCMGPWQPEWSVDTGLPEVLVEDSVLSDTLWTADTRWRLTEVVYVEAGAKLVIEPGTTVVGDAGAALVVTRDSRLEARGREDDPVVFTSSLPAGERYAGAWGGVVLLGGAPVNLADARIEGVDEDETRGDFGGSDPEANCGVLEHVRIEFAGYEAYLDNELNGLTLGGCGSSTIVRAVQVHRTLDDGVEMFGGTVDLREVLVTQPGDDGLDWDMGWTGRAQFVIVQEPTDAGDNGIEADNYEEAMDALPRSSPVLSNVTLIGAGPVETAQRGYLLRHGTAGELLNFLVWGYNLEAADLRDAETIQQVTDGALDVRGALFANIGADGQSWFTDETEDDDDEGFDEAAWFEEAARAARFGEDPMLPAAALDLQAPDFIPAGESPAGDGGVAIPQGEFWEQGADYLGAVRPGSGAGWWEGWAAFPAD